MSNKTERPYQTEAIESVVRDLNSGEFRSLALVMATGSGKTFTLARVLRRVLDKFKDLRGATIVVVVHREELLEQTIEEFQDTNLPVSRWSADKKDLSGQVIVAMVGSSKLLAEELYKYNRTIVLEVVDEGHHYAADSYQKLSNQLEAARTLLVTATPIRADGMDLGIQKVSYDMSFLKLVEMGYLAKPIYKLIRIHGDSRLRSAGADYKKEDLVKLNNPERNKLIAEDYYNNRDTYKKTLTFCVNVEHCIELRAAYQALMPDLNTAIITSDTPRAERRAVVESYNEGLIDVMFNVNVFTEGTDIPSINTIQIARPTKSAGLWSQAVGRGSRVDKATGKYSFIIADYAGTENNYAWLADGFAQQLLGAPPDEELEEIRRIEDQVGEFNSWLEEEVGMKKKLRSQTEVLEVAGVLTMINRRGKERRLLVRKVHKDRLECFIEYIMHNPPVRGIAMSDYVERYARAYDRSLFKWPGKYNLQNLGWCLYHYLVTNKGEGKPLAIFKPVPDFHDL